MHIKRRKIYINEYEDKERIHKFVRSTDFERHDCNRMMDEETLILVME